MKTIFTRKGQPIYVDDADYDWLVQWPWYLSAMGYAVFSTSGICGQKRSKILMHRMLLGLTDPKVEVDHRNGVKHDNQRHNLRTATCAENQRNRSTQLNSACGLKGASFHKSSKKWRAQIQLNGKRKHLGVYDTAEEAHAAYCSAAIEMHGEFANTGAQRD